MFHLGIDWDYMVYEKLVVKFKVIISYMHRFDCVWFPVQSLENIFLSACRKSPITKFSTWLNHLPLNWSLHLIIVNILPIKVFILLDSCDKQWSFCAMTFFHCPRQD